VLGASAGDLLCWPPGCDHELLDASVDFDLYVVGLTPELSERVLGRCATKVLSGPLRVHLPPSTSEALRRSCSVSLASLEPVVVERRVGELWREAHAARAGSVRAASSARRVLRSLLDDPDLTRADRARLLRAHPSEISRCFHRELGVTLTEYRTRLRLLRFIEGVDAGDSTLLGAALGAGFGSYSQCHRAFRDALGCSPSRFFRGDGRARMAEAFAPW
jgi:AraC-like DNA-binding protein